MTATVTGPFFRAPARVVRAICDDIEHTVGAQALSEVHNILNAKIQNPTPYYETQIRITNQRDSVVVDDRGVIYGPWLEGVGSRNGATRFKGYHAFRNATQIVEKQAQALAERVIAQRIGELN